jgi:translocation and assembly module TamA
VHPPGAARDATDQIVSHITFLGASSIDRSELMSGLALRPPQGWLDVEWTYFDPLSHRLDVQRIVAFYREHGFLSATVTKAEVVKKGKKHRALIYHIEEGPQTTIRSVQVEIPEGSAIDALALRAQSKLEVGTPLNYEQYEDGKDELVRSLLSQGYGFAQVTGQIKVTPDKTEAEVLYRVKPGPLATFGALTIVGNHRIPQSVIRSRIRFREGDNFSWKLLEESKTALYELGVFASVEFDVDRQDTEPATPVTLRVKEASRYELKLGAGAGIDRVNYELRARVRYRIASFLRPLGQLKLEATPRLNYLVDRTQGAAPKPAFEAAAGYTLPHLWGSNIDFNSKLSYKVSNFTGYSIQGPSLSLGLDRPFLDHRLLLGISWRLRQQYFFGIDESLDAEALESVGLVDPYRLGTLVQSVSYDRRDNKLFPTRGFYLAFQLEEATDYLGSRFEYIRASPEARGYYALDKDKDTVLAARLRLAGSFLLGDTLPITQRYFAGGSSSHRGFATRTLSPTKGADVPVGGEALIETNFEVRRALGDSDFRLVTFLDGAEVTEKREDLFANGLHWAAGLGLRYQTPFGTLATDVGYRLNRKGDDEPAFGDNWAWFLNLGEAF